MEDPKKEHIEKFLKSGLYTDKDAARKKLSEFWDFLEKERYDAKRILEEGSYLEKTSFTHENDLDSYIRLIKQCATEKIDPGYLMEKMLLERFSDHYHGGEAIEKVGSACINLIKACKKEGIDIKKIPDLIIFTPLHSPDDFEAHTKNILKALKQGQDPYVVSFIPNILEKVPDADIGELGDRHIAIADRIKGGTDEIIPVFDKMGGLPDLIDSKEDLNELLDEIETCVDDKLDPYYFLVGLESTKNIEYQEKRRRWKRIGKKFRTFLQKAKEEGVDLGDLEIMSTLQKEIRKTVKNERDLDDMFQLIDSIGKRGVDLESSVYFFGSFENMKKEDVSSFLDRLQKSQEKAEKKGLGTIYPHIAENPELIKDRDATLRSVDALVEKGLLPVKEFLEYVKKKDPDDLLEIVKRVKSDEKEGLKSELGKAALMNILAPKKISDIKEFDSYLKFIDPSKIPPVPDYHHKSKEYPVRKVKWIGKISLEDYPSLKRSIESTRDYENILSEIIDSVKGGGTGEKRPGTKKMWGVLKRLVFDQNPKLKKKFRKEDKKAVIDREARDDEIASRARNMIKKKKASMLQEIISLVQDPAVRQHCSTELNRALKALTWIEHGDRLKEGIARGDPDKTDEFYTHAKEYVRPYAKKAVDLFEKGEEAKKQFNKFGLAKKLQEGNTYNENVEKALEGLVPKKIRDEHRLVSSSKKEYEVVGHDTITIEPSSGPLDTMKYMISQDCSKDYAFRHLYADYFHNHRIYNKKRRWLGNEYVIEKNGNLIIETTQAHDDMNIHPDDLMDAVIDHSIQIMKDSNGKVTGVYMPENMHHHSNKRSIAERSFALARKLSKGKKVPLKLPDVESQSVSERAEHYKIA